jgi:predicted metalloprotease with PDZ domain
VNATTLPKRLADHAPGQRVAIAFFRRDELRTTELTLAESPERRLTVTLDTDAGPRARAVRLGWIGT